ncbi:unnamed protein product [Ostreobium quekettii]|uniref:Uncharacterized protein n=1 Tax=Ostreobium quekettii TaxID=121088 RepID=A0A8S1IVE8_9CHLO|nr:unnamed protein product [Ostreobium quekettii]
MQNGNCSTGAEAGIHWLTRPFGKQVWHYLFKNSFLAGHQFIQRPKSAMVVVVFSEENNGLAPFSRRLAFHGMSTGGDVVSSTEGLAASHIHYAHVQIHLQCKTKFPPQSMLGF